MFYLTFSLSKLVGACVFNCISTNLFLGVLLAGATLSVCRGPAVFKRAVTQPAVRCAGPDNRADTLAGYAAAVFAAEASANRGG